MKSLNNVAVIQVRTGSKRLPRKSLIKLKGLRIIDWVIKRTKKTSSINVINLKFINQTWNTYFTK